MSGKIKVELEKHKDKDWYRLISSCSCYPTSYTIYPINKEDIPMLKRIFNCKIKISFSD